VDEVGATFSRTSLFVIGRWRRSAADELTCYVAAHSRLWKHINDLPDPRGEIDQAFRQFIRCHIFLTRSSICNFHFSIPETRADASVRPDHKLLEGREFSRQWKEATLA
jgi:hypothetical protein